MSVYVDANVLIAFFVPDALTNRATSLVQGLSDTIIVSDVAALEVGSSVARMVRSRELTARAANQALADFDSWTFAQTLLEIQTADVAAAATFIRRFDINLHGADALHVAMTLRVGARLLTLDAKMRANARKLGVAVV